MNQENVQFKFMGFDPDYEIRSLISSVAENPYFSSPSDASTDIPIRDVQRIEQKIEDHLDQWKAWGFQNTKC